MWVRQITLKAGETVRQAAERTAKQLLVKSATDAGHPDDVAQLYFVGNCPAGWFWRIPEEDRKVQRMHYGEKVGLRTVGSMLDWIAKNKWY